MSTSVKAGAAAWGVVVMLMLAHVLSFVDRQVLNLMVGPIKADLAITDTQMSLLMGFSFALFYTLMGLPLASVADRGNRSRLIALGIGAWSLATAFCGMATRYFQLLLGRVGVGIGEATLSPSAFSLITDLFPREQRATAISVFGMGVYLGSGAAFLIGGLVIALAKTHGPIELPLLGEIRIWQVVFLVLGGVGLAFSLLFWLVREPARLAARGDTMPWSTVFTALRGNARALACHHVGFGMISLAGYGASAWIPSYLVRVHQWTMPQVGLAYGITLLVTGSLGIVLGGKLTDRLVARGVHDAPLRVGMFAALAAIPVGLVFYNASSPAVLIAMLGVATLILSMPFGAAPAGLQEIVPPAMRARASAIYLFVLNMLGLGCGPTAVALVTDYVFHDEMAVGQSLFWVCGSAQVIGALILSRGLSAYRDSYARQRVAETAA